MFPGGMELSLHRLNQFVFGNITDQKTIENLLLCIICLSCGVFIYKNGLLEKLLHLNFSNYSVS